MKCRASPPLPLPLGAVPGHPGADSCGAGRSTFPGFREAKPNTRGVFTFPAVGIHHARPSDEGRSCAALAPKPVARVTSGAPSPFFLQGATPAPLPVVCAHAFFQRPIVAHGETRATIPRAPTPVAAGQKEAAPWPCGARAAARKAVGSAVPGSFQSSTAQAGLEKGRSRAWAVCSLPSALRSLPPVPHPVCLSRSPRPPLKSQTTQVQVQVQVLNPERGGRAGLPREPSAQDAEHPSPGGAAGRKGL